MNPFVHIHSSSRYDRGTEGLKLAANKYNQDADLVTYTEVESKGRKAAVKEAAGDEFGCVFGAMPELANDQVITYRKSRFKLIHSETFKTSDFQYFAKRGPLFPKPAVVVAVLEDKETGKRFAISVEHLPASVEGNLAHKSETRRTVVWFDSFRHGKKYLNQTARKYDCDGRLFIADFNINFKRLWARTLVKTMAPSYMNLWKNVNIKGGTHGNRIIDATLARGDIGAKKPGAVLYEDDASSDHRPYI